MAEDVMCLITMCECFHMAVEQLTMELDPERCNTSREASQLSTGRHAHPLTYLDRSLWSLRQNRRQDSLVEAKESADTQDEMLVFL